jgi:HAMP domain-containing protein
LTALYAGTFLILGTAVIAITYLLAAGGSTITARAVPGPLVRELIDPGAQSQVGAQHSADVQHLLSVSWLVLAITAVISAFLGWFASGRVLRPLRDMAATAGTISAGNLSRRLAVAGPDD